MQYTCNNSQKCNKLHVKIDDYNGNSWNYTQSLLIFNGKNDIIFTKDSMAKIGAKYNLQGNTLTYIANGQRRKELTQDFITPLRKNILINQKI